MTRSNTKQSGFTLIELLVVISIVGILGSLILTGLAQARGKGRDAKRKADLVQMQKALEIYFNTYGKYPHTCGAVATCANITDADWYGVNGEVSTYSQLSGPNGYIPNISPEFLAKLPEDPLYADTLYSGYLYKSDGENYKLLSHYIGPESYPQPGEAFFDPLRSTTAWMITNSYEKTSNTCGPTPPRNPVTCW